MKDFGAVLGLLACFALAGCGDDTERAAGGDGGSSGESRPDGGGSGGDDACSGAVCGPCPPTNFRLEVRTTDEQLADVSVDGLPDSPAGGCRTVRHITTCHAPLAAGDYQVTASAPGYVPELTEFTVTALEEPAGVCCHCGGVEPDLVYINLDPTDDTNDGGTEDDAGR